MSISTRTIPVSVRAYLLDGRDGYLVKWKDRDKERCYFVLLTVTKKAETR